MENLIRYILALPDSQEKEQLLDLAMKNTASIVKPTNPESGILYGTCPRCGKPFISSYGEPKYCPECGQRLIFKKISSHH